MRHLPLFWQTHAPAAPCLLRPWLLDRGSLTQRIQQRCVGFSVRGVRLTTGKACRDEAGLVRLKPARYALLREVNLYCGDTPVVFAHSVIPLAGLHGPWRGLSRLGNKPLGVALFADPLIRRQPLQFRKLNSHHTLYRRACRNLAQHPPYLWARRSVFVLRGQPILVTEVFLPAILELAS